MTNRLAVVRRFSSLLGLLVATASAARAQTLQQDTAPYRPINPVPATTALRPAATLVGDYQRAARAKTLGEAMARWEAFLQAYDADEFEDGLQANHVRLAKYELMRVYYLLGRVTQADALIKKFAKP